jgi:hypothetical protein
MEGMFLILQIQLFPPQRTCFHPGHSSLAREGVKLPKGAKDISASQMIKALFTYLWPKVSVSLRKS